jgi:hypothetical protein
VTQLTRERHREPHRLFQFVEGCNLADGYLTRHKTHELGTQNLELIGATTYPNGLGASSGLAAF